MAVTKEKLQHIFNNDFPGIDSFISEVIEPIFGSDIIRVDEDLATNPEYEEKARLAHIKHLRYVADITEQNLNADNIVLLDVTLDDAVNIERSRVNIQQLIRSIVQQFSHMLIVFHYENTVGTPWRFSYAYKQESIANTTSAKRYTYVFGRDFRGLTAAERFYDLARSERKNADFESAFSVQTLSDEFFDFYRAYYAAFVEFITGKKYSTEKKINKILNGWKWRTSDSTGQFQSTFNDDGKATRDYIKKMFGRIVFLYFLQRKGWLYDSEGKPDANYMHHLFANAGERQHDFLDGVLELLFFHVLNTKEAERKEYAEACKYDITILPGWDKIPFLNGGLFNPDEIDPKKCVFPAVYFKEFFKFLDSYNFTIDENNQDDAEVGIDPEMLGRIFENLLEDNKAKGAFYTPKEVVDYMCREAIISYLQDERFKDEGNALIRRFIETLDISLLSENQRNYLEDKLLKVKICDPAIGSGAFPMGLVNLLSRIFTVLNTYTDNDPAKMKRNIMQQSIYGVDIEQGAVDIARLRFWLAMVVDEVTPQPLPNLHFKIMQGNSLIESYHSIDLAALMTGKSTTFDYISIEQSKELRSAIKLFYNETDHVKRSQRLNRIKNIVATMVNNVDENVNLTKLDVSANDQFFMWHTWFADVFEKGGFDIVIGNPPYGAKLSDTDKKFLNATYKSTGDDYNKGSIDTFSLFIELGFNLCKENGTGSFIIPLSVTASKSMEALHKLLLDNCKDIFFSSYGDRPKRIFESAEQQVSIIQFRRTNTPTKRLLTTGINKRFSNEALSVIFSNLHFVNSLPYVRDGRIPKIQTSTEVEILEKLLPIKTTLFYLMDSNGLPVYYRKAGGRYYKVITTKPTYSSAEGAIVVQEKYQKAVAALLSSSLFYWFWLIHSDWHNLRTSELDWIPFPKDQLDDAKLGIINAIYDEYEEDLFAKRKVTSTGLQNFFARESKPIADKIDNFFGPLFGLSDKEIQFIIDYDSRYRTNPED